MNVATMQKIKDILSEIPFFGDFNFEDIEYFVKQLSFRTLEQDTILFRQGDIGDYLFFVLHGNVAIKIDSTYKNKTIVANFGCGSSVGEMALVDEYPRSATVTATEKSEILILTRNRFNLINEENPNIGIKILRGLAKNLSTRLRATSGRFADIS